MKKQFLFAILLICALTLSVLAADDVVFMQNDTVTYATLAAAANALPETGGTIVVNIPVVHSSDTGVQMPAKPLVITSVYDGVDYAKTNGAYFGVGRTLQFYADVTLENITIQQSTASTTYGNIYARGNHLTIGEGVTTVKNATSGLMTQIYGGSADSTFGAPTHVTIKSGTWDRIYGGSYNKQTQPSVLEIMGGTVTNVYAANRANAFTGGTASVTVSGGKVTNLHGGNRQSTFTGNSSVTVTGGTVTYLYGGNEEGTFKGTATVDIRGGKVDYVYGGSNKGVAEANATVNYTNCTSLAIYGGSRQSSFKGNTVINMTGGTITHAIAGGAGPSGTAFTGDTEVNIMSGTVKHAASYGIFGGSIGASGKTVTHTGNAVVNIGGDAEIFASVYGTSYYSGVTTVGDVEINIGGNAKLHRHIYGGGYYGNVTTGEKGIVLNLGGNASAVLDGSSVYICGGQNTGTLVGNVTVNVQDNFYANGNIYAGGYFGSVTGNSTVNMTGGEITATVSAGSREGAVSGVGTVNALGGKIGYHSTGSFGFDLHGGTTKATLGSAVVVLDGADIAGAINTRTQNASVTLKSGRVGTVAEKAVVDLTGGKSLAVGGDLVASTLTGGGSLTLSAAGSLTADTFTGEVALVIDGTPVVFKPYVTVKDTATEGVITYTAADGYEAVKAVKDGVVTYAVAAPGMHETTKVTVTYYNPDADGEQPDIVVYRGASSSDTKTKIGDLKDGAIYEADLAPGLYYWKVYYNGSTDYRLKHFLVDGTKETLSFDVPFEPYAENGYMENVTAETTDEVLEAFFSTKDLVGFNGFDTPTFTEKYLNTRVFMTNEDLCAYATQLDADCDYLYTFLAELHDETNLFPVLVFTKDEIPEGASLDEIAKIVRAGGTREIFMATGGIHGNEPAGEEGVLNFAKALSGEYGEALLAKEHVGAVVLMPAASPQNLQRFERTYADGENPNRDVTSLRHGNTQMIAHVYDLFMPTVYFDCHEDTSGTNAIDASDNSYSNIDDVVFSCTGLPNAPAHDMRGIIAGDKKMLENEMYTLLAPMIAKTGESGVRSGYYQWTYYGPGQADAYAMMRGSYGYLIEVMRIWTGKSHYTRAVFAMQQALMSAVDVIADKNGSVAQTVAANRAAAAVESFDESNPFVLKMASGKSGISFTYDHPSVYADGTYKDANATVTRNRYDTPTSARPMATGYVLDAGASDVAGVKAKLEQAGIDYVMLPAGTTLTLRKYTTISNGKTDPSVYGEAEEVTFANGALAVHTNCSDAYLVAYYFEPDSYYADDTIASLYQNGLIAETDALYRSEENGFAAKITPEDETVENDFNGDGEANIADVLLLLREVLNGKTDAAYDLNGDGKVNLVDALHLLKWLAY